MFYSKIFRNLFFHYILLAAVIFISFTIFDDQLARILLGLAAVIIAGYFSAAAIVRPATAIRNAVGQMSRSNFAVKIPVSPVRDEISDLAVSLNMLVDEITMELHGLENEKNELAVVLSGMTEGVLVIAPDKRVVTANPSFVRMFLLPEKETRDRYYWEVLQNSEIISFIKKVFEEKENAASNISVRQPSVRHYAVQASALKEHSGGFAGLVAVFHDVTRVKMLEETRKDFVANVSHEMKTPLAAVKGFAETLAEGGGTAEEIHEFSETILRHANRLDSIVKDLLLLSSLESDDPRMNFTKVKINDVLEPAVSLFSAKAKDKVIELTLDIPASLPQVMGDREKLEQLFINLLDNAIKFTPEKGRISIKCYQKNSMFGIDVSDTGIGIPSEYLDRIFERFYRVDPGRSREMGGTGLGLSIVRHIASAHNGKVTVTSSPSIGSTFSVFLPTT